jgi:hypothetical protein
MTHNREAWPLNDGRIGFWLPLADGGQVELLMTAAQAEQCASDLLGAVIDQAQQQNDGRNG